MGVIDQTYLPSRQRTEDAELDDWMGIAPLPRLNVAPLPEAPGPPVPGQPAPTAPGEPASTMGLTITPKGVPPEPPGFGLNAGEMAGSFEAQPGMAPPPGAAPPDLSGVFQGIRAVESDINVGMKEAPKQILGGARDAVVNAADFLVRHLQPGLPGSRSEPKPGTGLIPENVPTVGEAASVTGGLVRNASQFLTGFAALGGVGGAGVLANTAKGAIVDMTVFDPSQPRISNLINSLLPALKNPVTDYLAADPHDTDAEGRFKNALEGLPLGLAVDGLITVVKGMKASQLAKSLGGYVRGEEGAINIVGGITAEQAKTIKILHPTTGKPLPGTFKQLQDVGTAIIAREQGTIDRAIWQEAMQREIGRDFTPAEADALWEGSRQRFEDTLENIRKKNVAANVEDLRKQKATEATRTETRAGVLEQIPSPEEMVTLATSEGAITGERWYWDAMPTLKKIFGQKDGEMMAKFIAATSPLTGVDENVRHALHVYKLWKLGRPITAETLAEGGIGLTDVKLPNIREAIEGRPFDPKTSPKVANFEAAIKGDPNAVTVDTWMARVLSGGEMKVSPSNYGLLAEWIRQGASDAGMSPRDYQAALWVGAKIAEESITRFGVEPLKDFITTYAPGVKDELKTQLSHKGEETLGVTAVFARMVAGAIGGSFVGDTPEERMRNAAIGMGLGVIASPSLIKRAIGLADEAGLGTRPGRGQAGSAQMSGGREPIPAGATPTPAAARATPGTPPPPPRPATPGTREAAMQEAAARQAAIREQAFRSPGRFNPAYQMASEEVKHLTAEINVRAREAGIMEQQTRGHQTWDEADRLANDLITSGKMSLERILALRPGDVLNAEEGLAARNIRDTAATLFRDLMDQADRGDDVAKAGLEKAALLASRIETNIEASTGTEIARAMAIRRHASAGVGIDEIYQRLTQRTIDPEVLYQFYTHLTSNTQREDFTKYLESTSRTGRWINALLEARSAGLLTIRSIERNLIGSGMTTLWSVPERAATAVTGMLTRTEDRAVLSEVGAMLHGFWNVQSKAISAMGQALKTGESQFLPETSQLEQHTFAQLSSQALNLGRFVDLPGGMLRWDASPMGKFFDVAGEIIRLPFRGLVAGDDYWKYVNYDMEKYALARREYDKLIEGGASPAQAAKEYSALITQPPEWLDKAATEHSLYTTFNDEVLNVAGKAILDVRANEGPVGQVARLILPFAKTPMNVAGYGAERTPGLNFLSIHYHNEIKAGGVRRDAARARLALGAGIYSTFAVLAANGLITGKGPQDPELAKIARDNGFVPYSINIPGLKPVSYLGYSPFSEIMGNAADFAELMFQGADDVTLDRVATASVLSSVHVMEEHPMLKGLADIHDAINTSSSRSEDAIQTVLKSVLPVPGFRNWAQMTQAFTDPYQRETRSPQGGATYTGLMGVLQRDARAIIEEAMASTPWLSNYAYPKRDILGRPLLRQGGGWVLVPNAPSPQTPHPIFDELIKQGVSVGLPTKAFSPGKAQQGVLDEDPDRAAVTLDAKEWARYQELSGTWRLSEGEPDHQGLTLEQELTRLLGSSEYAQESDGPRGGKASMLKDTFRAYRQAAKEQLYEEQRTEGQPGRLETLVQQKELLREFEKMNQAEQQEARPELEKQLKRPVRIGILR